MRAMNCCSKPKWSKPIARKVSWGVDRLTTNIQPGGCCALLIMSMISSSFVSALTKITTDSGMGSSMFMCIPHTPLPG